MKEKPNRYKLTEFWGPRILVVWYIIFLLLGLVFMEFPDGLTFPILGAVASFLSIFIVRKVLQFQKKNSEMMKRKDYDFAISFFWFFGMLASLMFLIGSAIVIWKGEDAFIIFFFLSFALFPLSTAIGASKQWEMRDVFKT